MPITISASRLQTRKMSRSPCQFEDLAEKELEKLRHRGRAYQCTTCLTDEKKVMIMEKGRMEAHILKEHVAPARVLFRCSLCQFRCLDRATLDGHVNKYKPHGRMVKEAGGGAAENCLKQTSCPYQMFETDYHVKSQNESPRVWHELKQIRMGARQNLSFLDGPVAESVTVQLENMDALVPTRTDRVLDGASNAISPELPPAQATQADQTLQLLSSLLSNGLVQLGPNFDASSLTTIPLPIQNVETHVIHKTLPRTIRSLLSPGLLHQCRMKMKFPLTGRLLEPFEDPYQP